MLDTVDAMFWMMPWRLALRLAFKTIVTGSRIVLIRKGAWTETVNNSNLNACQRLTCPGPGSRAVGQPRAQGMW